jgi:archaemetzincin
MKTKAGEKLHLLPLGEIPGPVLHAIGAALTDVYGFEVLEVERVLLPVAAQNIDRQQFLSTMVIEEIERMGLRGVVLGVADEDLYAQGLNFVFGEADRERRVAVISIARLTKEFYGGGPDEGLLVDRAVKEAVHEVGHVVGLPHCPRAECVMHFSNTISDTDRKGARPCELCRRTYSGAFG